MRTVCFAICVLALLFPSVALAADAGSPTTKPVIFVCGDSTAKNNGKGKNGDPVAGWGTPIAAYFDPAKVTVSNVAHAGQSSLTYYNRDWPNVLPKIKSGDYLLLVFGINDGTTLGGIGEETREGRNGDLQHTYGWYMAKMATDAQQAGRARLPLDRYDAEYLEQSEGQVQ